MFRSLLAAAALCVLTPSLAQAQIYSWRDPAGRLIMSDQPHDGATKVYAVSTASSVSEFRVTKPASADELRRAASGREADIVPLDAGRRPGAAPQA